jgi:hypothetical protein
MKSKAEELAEQYQDQGCIEGQLFFENARTRWAKQDFLAGYSARDEEVSLLKQELETARREFKIMKDAPETLQAKLDEAASILSGLSKRHEWQPGFGECICPFHKQARQFLKQTKGEK